MMLSNVHLKTESEVRGLIWQIMDSLFLSPVADDLGDEEDAGMGFLGGGTCIGSTGHYNLEFWPASIVTFVPSVIMVLEQVQRQRDKEREHGRVKLAK